MIWRANPGDDQLAVLSLPRDLYVDIAGGSKARINSAFRRNDPTRLVDTIYLNFGIPIDHYVQVDFCAFKGLVDAVGGVEVPFEFPARDRGSGLDIPEAGCVNLEGDMALAYVRSRKYQYEDPPGSDTWRTDGTSDFGRIARQQDFLRRVVAKVIDDGLYSPSVLTAMIETNREYLVTDAGLTLQRMLEFGNTLRRLDAEEITTYRIESQSQRTADGSQVERPLIRNSNMQAILAVFKGEARLADAPDQTFTADDDGQDTAEAADTTTTEPDDDPIPSASTTLPTVEAEENIVGVAPTRDDICA
jgi:LCP family protein required for cell wall assembly